MEKRGQFFLIAALVIASLLVALSSVVNFAYRPVQNQDLYSLSDEINFETKQVIDYGTYYTQDTNSLMQSFLSTYADYIAQDKVVFLFGNKGAINGLVFSGREIQGSTGISTGGSPTTLFIQQSTQTTAEVESDKETVRVVIGGVPYTFELRDGQNFFFVIQKEESDESYVATS